MREIEFTYSPVGYDRTHSINEDDIKVVLQRLPEEVWQSLTAIHFDDRGRSNPFWVRAGYVRSGRRRELNICAWPPRVSLTPFLKKGETPSSYGALRGCHWPRLAVRRFMLYNAFLHELGHLQVINKKAQSERRKFAAETLANEFDANWRKLSVGESLGLTLKFWRMILT